MENKSEKILKILEEKAPTTGKEIAKEALRLGGHKLPVKVKILSKEESLAESGGK